jgi:hypothetical protein
MNDLLDKLSLQLSNSNLPQIKINNLLTQASEAILCDAECQFQKESELLYQEYLNAQLNLEQAPHEFHEAQKKYMVYTEGKPAYTQFIDAELTEKADVIVDKYKLKFAEESQQVGVLINTYRSNLINFKNVFDLYIKYVIENKRLLKELKQDESDILTNDRKAYYEDQSLDKVKNLYFYILVVIYVLCILVFVICFFMKPSSYSRTIVLVIFVCLIALPFLSYWIVAFVLFVCYKIYSIIPKNVYTQLKGSSPSS